MNLIEATYAHVQRASRRLGWFPPLLVRVVLGVTFIRTGWGKLHNLEQVTGFFDSLGIPAASVQAPFVAGVEFVGGIMILVGLGTRVAAVLLSGVMAVAIALAIWPKQTFTDTLASVEAIYFAALACLAVGGGGAMSLDGIVARFIAPFRGSTVEPR